MATTNAQTLNPQGRDKKTGKDDKPGGDATPERKSDRPSVPATLLRASFGYLGEVMILLGQTIRALRHGVNVADFIRQLSVIGVETVPIALLTVGFTGAVLALYTVTTLVSYGANDLVGGIVALSILREIGPILTGVVVAARAGSAMAAEIGSMKVTEQIDALRAMGISPVEYLIVPRLLAGIVTLPALTLCADLSGIFGGGIVASLQGVGWATYINSVRQMADPDGSDIYKGLIKTIVFGMLIVLVGCREGMATEGGAVGVGNSTTRSVVLAIILVFIANYFLSYMIFHKGGG